MKQLLTIVMLFVCITGRSQTENSVADLNLDFGDLQNMLSMNDNTTDTFLSNRNWLYQEHAFDTARNSFTTTYVFGRGKHDDFSAEILIRTDTEGERCAVNLIYMSDIELNKYVVGKAVENGFKYKSTFMKGTAQFRFYENEKTHIDFVTSTYSNGDGVDKDGREFKAQRYLNAVTTHKRCKQWMTEIGMKN